MWRVDCPRPVGRMGRPLARLLAGIPIVACALLWLGVYAAPAQVLINEVDADTPGVDSAEFVELYDGGSGNTALDGLVVVFFNGNGDVSYAAFDLDGFSTNSEGYFVLGNEGVANVDLVFPGNRLQNGADAVALYAGNASDFPNGTAVTTTNLIDALVYDTNDADDAGLLVLLNAGQPQVNEGAAGDKDHHSNQRIPNGSGGARNTETYQALPPTPGTRNLSPESALEIFEIQGDGLASPVAGLVVTTRQNVVTAVADNGFFMQTPDARDDQNPQTSNGIFVYTGAAPSVGEGDLVDVTGKVIEFHGMTEFSESPTVTVTGGGAALPAVVEFNAQVPSPMAPPSETELERFEGMLVRVTEGVAAAPTDGFGEVKIVAADSRPFREPGIPFPGLPGLPVWDGNPEIFELDPDGLGLPDRLITGGSGIVLATGPLGFSFGDYQLLPKELTVEPFALPRPVRPAGENEVSVATQNLLALFDTIDDPRRDEPVPTAEEFETKLSKLSLHIRQVLGAPDILAVQEVENLGVLRALADRIQTDDPTLTYTAFLREGNDVGGIDVGFLVKQTVSVDSVQQIGKRATFELDGSVFTLHDRPPLVLYAKVGAEPPRPLRVMVVHLRSMIGIADDPDSTRVRTKRFEQARWIAQRIQEMQEGDLNTPLVVLGDFNAFEFTDGYVDVLGQITGRLDPAGALLPGSDEVEPDLRNQVLALPPEERYSFVRRGTAQALDHILTSAALDDRVSDVAFARGNADAPEAFATDPTTPLRSSDHDGLVVYLKLDVADAVADPAGEVPRAFALAPNYPNPFNPETAITFDLPRAAHVTLRVFNARGQLLRTLVSQAYPAGRHRVRWDGRDEQGQPVASGVYLYEMRADGFAQAHKMLLLR